MLFTTSNWLCVIIDNFLKVWLYYWPNVAMDFLEDWFFDMILFHAWRHNSVKPSILEEFFLPEDVIDKNFFDLDTIESIRMAFISWKIIKIIKKINYKWAELWDRFNYFTKDELENFFLSELFPYELNNMIYNMIILYFPITDDIENAETYYNSILNSIKTQILYYFSGSVNTWCAFLHSQNNWVNYFTSFSKTFINKFRDFWSSDTWKKLLEMYEKTRDERRRKSPKIIDL